MLSLQQRIQEVLDIGLAEVRSALLDRQQVEELDRILAEAEDRYARGQAEVDGLRDEFSWL